MEPIGWVFLIFGLILITQRWFWLLVFFFATLASFFAMVASVIHFEILGAIGFFILMGICGVVLGAINAIRDA
jgi:ABC-type multidrug transport system permease subunit